MWETIIVGLISSVIASLTFYLWMFLIRPRFNISEDICIADETANEIYYKIKVVNLSRAMLTDIDYSLMYCTEKQGNIRAAEIIKPEKPPLRSIEKYNKKNSDYAIRFTYKVDKKSHELIGDNRYFIFTFQAHHSFSNSMRVKKVEYREWNTKRGRFETKKGMEILE